MERDFKVVGKALRGKDEVPVVVLRSEEGDRLELHLDSKGDLAAYQIEEVITVKVSKEQKRLA